MSRKITVEIDLAPETPGTTCVRYTGSSTHYYIHIRQDIKKLEAAPLVALLHELGHVAGYIMQTPGAAADPRHHPDALAGILGDNPGEPILASEEEAWTFAEQMFARVRELTLGNYRRVWRMRALFGAQ